MIEVVYNKKDEEIITHTNVKLPKNIRQIGNGSAKRRIYIEDYVMSYITELGKKARNEKIVGVLLGENCMWEESKYLFIKGTVKVKNEIFEEGRIILTEKSWMGIYDDIKKYFPLLNILGWFVILDDADNLPKGSIEKTHVDNFAGNEKTLFMFETEKEEQGFYFFENSKLVKEDGYYIYYERNEDMQEYMICNDKKAEPEKPSFRQLVMEKEEERTSKSHLKFMYSVSTFLVVVILVMAIQVMNGYSKLKDMEKGMDNYGNNLVRVEGNISPTKENVEVGATVSQIESQSQTQTQSQTESQTQVQSEAESQTVTQEQTGKETESKTTAVTQKSYRTHVVASGENLIQICRHYYGDKSMLEEIMKINNITDPNKIYGGQTLKLP